MLQGNKNKSGHTGRVRDKSERKRKAAWFCLCVYLCGVPIGVNNSPFLPFPIVSSEERNGLEPPLATGSAHLLKT